MDWNALGPWLAILAFVAVFAPIAFYTYSMQQRRAQAYRAFAATTGYTYVMRRPGEEAKYTGILPMFGQGHGQTWQHEISGTFNGLPFTAFEYVYFVGYGRSQTTHRQAMIKWESASATLPQFTLGPENFFSRIGQALGSLDIDFPEDEPFSRDYVLRGQDEAAVRTLFTQALRSELASQQGQHLAGGGRVLFWWRNGSLPGPDGCNDFLSAGDRIRQLFFAG